MSAESGESPSREREPAPHTGSMSRTHGQAPTWLYSFVDLAFLMLIAFSQVDIDTRFPALAEIDVPRVRADATHALDEGAETRAVVRVHPPTPDSSTRFSVVVAGTDAAQAPRLDADALNEELVVLRARLAAKPLLAPHEHSLSRDMLTAVATVDALWPSHGRTATIAPVSALQ